MGSTHQVANASNATLEINRAPTAHRVRAVPLLATRFGKVLMVGLAHGVKPEKSPMQHARVAMHASRNTRTMAINATHVDLELNRTHLLLQSDASHALPSEARTYPRQEIRVCSVVRAVSRVAT